MKFSLYCIVGIGYRLVIFYFEQMSKVGLTGFFFFLFSSVCAQQSPYVFSNLTEKDGLSSNNIYCFLKDKRGMLWVGTVDGLNLYDGSHFTVFRKGKDTSRLVTTEVYSLCEDNKGRIWGGTENGIFSYDLITDRFTNYYMPVQTIDKFASNIYCDKNGVIWITAGHLLLKFDSLSRKIVMVNSLTTSKDSISTHVFRKNGLIPDPKGNGLWLATRIGIIYYDITRDLFTGYKEEPGNMLFARRSSSAMANSNKGYFWFYDNTSRKFHAFDPLQKKLLFEIDLSKEMPNSLMATIFEDEQQRLWFSNWNYTVGVIDYRKSNKLISLKRDVKNPSSIRDNFFWSAFQDDDGTVWLGTMGGISKSNIEKTVYRVINTAEIIPEAKGDFIPLLTEDPINKTWWFCTSYGQIINYDPLQQHYRLYETQKAKPNRLGLKPGNIVNLKHSQGNLVICTKNGAWELVNNIFQPFTRVPKTFEDFVIVDMEQQGDSVYYFSNGSDILYWNRNLNQAALKTFPDSVDGKAKRNHITRITWKPSINRSLWFYNSLNQLFEVDEHQFKKHPLNLEISSGYFSSIEIDNYGKIWAVCYGQGIYRYDPYKKQSKLFDQTNGLTNVRLFQLAADNTNRIWAISLNKMSVLDQRTGAFNNFPINVDVTGTNFYNFILRLSNGNILASVKKYLVEFFPEKLDYQPNAAKPLISSLTVSGRSLIPSGQDFQFEPEQNSVRLNFGMLTDRETFPFDFEYKLDGFDRAWISAGNDDMAVYNNLKSGDYTFRLVAKGENGRWVTKESVLHFTIRTPFYETWWFRGLMLLMVAGIVAVIYRLRLMQKTRVMKLESRAQMLEKEKALVMYENLKQQLNPHFLFNSLTSLNSLIEDEPKAAREFLESLSKTYRYILKSRDNELVSLGDEVRFAESYVKLQKTRFEEGLDVKMNIPEEFYHRKLVPVSLQNLIENAIKHNIIDTDSPLVIEIYVDSDQLIVKNNLQKKNFVETSNRTGLASMQSLYHYLSERPMEIEETQTSFIVKIPLI